MQRQCSLLLYERSKTSDLQPRIHKNCSDLKSDLFQNDLASETIVVVEILMNMLSIIFF